jgi:hypothetical protein
MATEDSSIFSKRLTEAKASLISATSSSQRQEIAAYLSVFAEEQKEKMVTSSEPEKLQVRIKLLREIASSLKPT